MDKRLLRFLLFAMPIYILCAIWMQRNQQQRDAYKAEQERLAAVAAGYTTDSLTQALPESTLEPAEPEAEVRPTALPLPPQRPTDVETILVETDYFAVEFSPLGGVPIRWDIIDPEFVNGSDVAETPPEDLSEEFVAEEEEDDHRIELIDPALDEYGMARNFEVVLKELNARFYHELNNGLHHADVQEGEEEIIIRFESVPTDAGLRMIKTYTIPRRGYLSRLEIRFVNDGASRLTFNKEGQGLGLALGPGLGRPPGEPGQNGKASKGAGGMGARYDYTDAFYRLPEGIENLPVKKPDDPQFFSQPNGDVALAGLNSRYFMIAVAPEQGVSAAGGFISGTSRLDQDLVTKALANKKTLPFYPRAEFYGDPFEINPGQQKEFAYTIFTGPKDNELLLEMGADYGLRDILFYKTWNWMRGVCFALMWLLRVFHNMFASWGIAIIVLVVFIRTVMFPLTYRQLKMQAVMTAQQKKLKPHLDRIAEKYKTNPQKKSAETMKLYKEHNINPLGQLRGCLWLFIQLPIFFALYRLLSQDFDLRGASFLWIDDLSKPDRLFALGFTIPIPIIGPMIGEYFNLLPILTSATQMLVSVMMMKSQGTPSDPTQAAMQKQMMYMMPVMILFMTYGFPSGLVLYWLISNLWQLGQQEFVNKRIKGQMEQGIATT